MTNATLNAATGTLEVNGKTIDLTALPGASISALISRGASHFFGSEQASRVKAWKDAFLEEHKTEAGEDEIVAKQAERFEIAMKALLEGTIGQRSVGITIDPLEKVKEQIARQQVSDILRTNGLKVPKKDEAVQFPDGSSKTMEAMIKTRLELKGEEIEKAAKKQIADRAKAKAAVEAEAKSATAKTAEGLGL